MCLWDCLISHNHLPSSLEFSSVAGGAMNNSSDGIRGANRKSGGDSSAHSNRHSIRVPPKRTIHLVRGTDTEYHGHGGDSVDGGESSTPRKRPKIIRHLYVCEPHKCNWPIEMSQAQPLEDNKIKKSKPKVDDLSQIKTPFTSNVDDRIKRIRNSRSKIKEVRQNNKNSKNKNNQKKKTKKKTTKSRSQNDKGQKNKASSQRKLRQKSSDLKSSERQAKANARSGSKVDARSASKVSAQQKKSACSGSKVVARLVSKVKARQQKKTFSGSKVDARSVSKVDDRQQKKPCSGSKVDARSVSKVDDRQQKKPCSGSKVDARSVSKVDDRQQKRAYSESKIDSCSVQKIDDRQQKKAYSGSKIDSCSVQKVDDRQQKKAYLESKIDSCSVQKIEDRQQKKAYSESKIDSCSVQKIDDRQQKNAYSGSKIESRPVSKVDDRPKKKTFSSSVIDSRLVSKVDDRQQKRAYSGSKIDSCSVQKVDDRQQKKAYLESKVDSRSVSKVDDRKLKSKSQTNDTRSVMDGSRQRKSAIGSKVDSPSKANLDVFSRKKNSSLSRVTDRQPKVTQSKVDDCAQKDNKDVAKEKNMKEVTGNRQSPIDIQTSDVVAPRSKRSAGEDCALKVDYSALTGVEMEIENTGHGWKLNIPDELAQSCPITGGPLGTDKYRLLQIHCHWGKNNDTGSEHTINGKMYPGEMHLVHWNASKYSNPTEAQLYTNDGLAVIGVFLQLTSTDEQNVYLTPIVDSVKSIAYKNEKTTLKCPDLNQLVPNRTEPRFWNYLGSLTTPPYNESVIWIVMTEPIEVDESQIASFRELNENEKNHSEHRVEENFRAVQALNNRSVVQYD